MNLYRCPRTTRTLLQRDHMLQTTDGEMRYPVTDDVPDFRLTPPTDPKDELAIDAMTRTATRDGFRVAVRTHRPELLAYVDAPSRAQFLDLLPLDRETRALEIGPGLGQITVPLAGRVKVACALEISPSQARFVARRCREAGLHNVHVAAGCDDLRLPYADASFDVVIVNMVFEWVREPSDDGATLGAQQQLLREIRRVLAPGGTLFLSTKNRYALRYLLGGRDENARHLRFGNALPRAITSRLCAQRSGPLGLLHSYASLADLLRSEGFDALQSFWATPDSRYPERYVPLNDDAIRRARRDSSLKQGPTRATRLLMPWVPARWVKHVASGLTFIAHKPEAAATAKAEHSVSNGHATPAHANV